MAAVMQQPAQTAEAPDGGLAGGDHVNWRVVFLCLFVANTGFFHGYDNGVVSEVFTMPSFREIMGWPAVDNQTVAFQKGLTVNGFNIGAAAAAICCGHLIVDRRGRKPALVLGSLLFAAGGVLQSAAVSGWMLILGRLVAGVGVGITSCAGPAYIAEVAPASIRGAMVGLYQSNICLAIVGASVLNYFDHDLASGWRWSLAVQVILGVATAGGLLFVKDTPRFLESVGRSGEALKVLSSLRNGDEGSAARELAMVRAELEEERRVGSATWSELLFDPYFRNLVALGCFFQFFQIITGINAVVSFGGTLFSTLGIHGLASALLPSVAFVVGNSIGSFILVDRVGRRTLLIFGMVGMAVAMLVGGSVVLATRQLDASGAERLPAAAGYVVIATIFAYMFSFGVSWGFGAWLYVSEIMPLRVRGKAVGLCTGVNWGTNVITAFVAPALIAGPAGPGGMLMFFGVMSAVVVPFTVFCTPETRAKTLEEITPMFRFATCHDFVQFVRGNLRTGEGMGAIASKAAGAHCGKDAPENSDISTVDTSPTC